MTNKNNFNEHDLKAIILTLCKLGTHGYSFRFNRSGNLELRRTQGEWFVLYHNTPATGSGYLWRHHGVGSYGSNYSHPLNQKRPKTVHYYTSMDGTKKSFISDWSGTKPCEFSDIQSALDYFMNYLKKTKRIKA